MSKLRANVDELRAAENDLAAVKTDLAQLYNDMQTIRSEINVEWQGFAADTFKYFLNYRINQVNNMQNVVSELKEYSQTVGNQMEALDKLLDFIISILTGFKG